MKEEKLSKEPVLSQEKKPYIKPALSKIRLVADEAVLALCKYNNGVKSACMPNLSCVRTRRS